MLLSPPGWELFLLLVAGSKETPEGVMKSTFRIRLHLIIIDTFCQFISIEYHLMFAGPCFLVTTTLHAYNFCQSASCPASLPGLLIFG